MPSCSHFSRELTVGNVKEEVPHYQGKPLLDPDQARELMAGGPRDDVQIKPVREGRIRWESLTTSSPSTSTGTQFWPVNSSISTRCERR